MVIERCSKGCWELDGYDPDSDQLVMLGDYIDCGPDLRGTVDYVMELLADGAVALSGNYESS